MTLKYKLFSAASALAMAMAVGAAYADELTADQLDTVTAGAAVAGSGPGLSNASVVASSTNGVTAGGGNGLNAATFANAGSGTAAAVFGIPGAGSVTVAGAAP